MPFSPQRPFMQHLVGSVAALLLAACLRDRVTLLL